MPSLIESLSNIMRSIRGGQLQSPIPEGSQPNLSVPSPTPQPQFFEGGQLPGRASVPQTPQNLRPLITQSVRQNPLANEDIQFVDELLLSALLGTESSFRPDVQGFIPVGQRQERAQGIAQFLPSTAEDISRRGIVSRGFDPRDPQEAVPASAAFLDHLIRRASLQDPQNATISGLTRYKGSRGRAQEVLDLIGR